MMQPNNICTYTIAAIVSLLCLLPVRAGAQQRIQQPAEEADSLPLIRSWAVSADAVGAVQLWVSDYGQYEAALRINLKDHYFPILEAGLGKASHNDDVTGICYESSAPYFRIGCDFNVLKNKHDIYRVYAGVRYGFTSFSYDISSPGIADPVWGGEALWGEQDVKCSCHWAEGLVGVDAKIAGPLRMGWSVRYKSRLSQTHGDAGEPWYVPGFGKSGSTRLGATFNISLEF